MANDKESIGLTSISQQRIAELEGRGWFNEAADIARFCLAYAVRAKIPTGDAGKVETRWAAGNFDKAGEIRALMRVMYPDCDTPNRLMEHLVNEGLEMVHARVVNDLASPSDLLG